MRTGRTSWPPHPSTSISTACPTCAANWQASSPKRRSRNERSPLRVRRDRGIRRHPAIAPDGGEARGGPGRPRDFHPPRGRGRLGPGREGADVVVVHDPQPACLIKLCERRKGKWIWRAHIDISRPFRPVWKVLRTFAEKDDASIFSMAAFPQPPPHPQFLVPPSIDPLREKNRDLDPAELSGARAEFGLDPDRPLLVQISRFDRFKAPIGGIGGDRLLRAPLGWHLALV